MKKSLEPLVSVIVATYNRRTLLVKCVESVLSQTYKNWELILVDDGSDDGTENDYQDQIDPRIKFFRLPGRGGAFTARNFGLRNMAGDYFIIWDSDDQLSPDALSALVLVAQEGDYDAVFAPADFVDGRGRTLSTHRRPTGVLSWEELVQSALPSNDTVILLKSAVRGDIFFLGPNIDFSFYLLFCHKRKVLHLDQVLGRIRLESDRLSETTARRKANMDKSIVRARGLDVFLKDVGDDLLPVSPVRYGANCYGAAVGLLLDGKIVKARRWAREAFKHGDRPLYFGLFYLGSLLPFASWFLRTLFRIRQVGRI